MPAADPSPRQALLAELQQSVRRYHRDIDEFDQVLAEQLHLNRTDLRCVDLLFDEPLSLGRLAARAGVTPAAATTIVDRLTRAGFVRRLPDPDDRRRIAVEVTPQLLRRVAELLGPYVEDAARDTAGYTNAELEVLCLWLGESHDRRAAHIERMSSDLGSAHERPKKQRE